MTIMNRKALLTLMLVCIAMVADSDSVELKNGDRISGKIVSMNDTAVRLKTNYGIIDIPRQEIVYGEFGNSAASAKTTASTDTAETAARTVVKTTAPASGLILECLLDGYIRDSSGSGHAIKKSGSLLFINGLNQQASTALLADGTGAYLEVENSTILETLDSFTLSCWFYIQAEKGSQYLIAKWEKTTGQTALGKFALSYSKNSLYFYIVDENGYFHGIKQEAAVNLQTWYHTAVSYNKGKMILYLDGEKLTEKEITARGLFKETSPVYLMSAKSFGQEGWAYYNLSGRLDNVRIYNRALSDAEIKQLYREKDSA